MSNEVCGDNRFEIIEKAKQDLLESTNIQTSEDEMQVIDNILFRCWQMGWLEKYNQPKADWIPFEQREADVEEKEYWLENYGQEIEYMLCGRLPDEDEEILVSYSNGCVGEDIFMCDGHDCYLDSGNELVTEAIAWMPKPQPFKKEGAE